MKKLSFLVPATIILLLGFFLAKPTADIVPQFVSYFNGAGSSLGPVAINGTLTVNGSEFIAGSGKGFGVGNISIINQAPGLGAGWGGTPSITSNNGTFTFKVNVGSGGVATTGTVTFATTTAGWNCVVQDDTNNIVTRVTSNTSASVSVTAASAWSANDILSFICVGF